MTSSGTTARRSGRPSRSRFCFLSSLAAKPRKALPKLRSALTPSRLRTLLDDGGRVDAVAEHDDEATGGVGRPSAGRRGSGVGLSASWSGRSVRRRAARPVRRSAVGLGRSSARPIGVGSGVGVGSAAGLGGPRSRGRPRVPPRIAGATTGRAMSTARNRAASRRCMRSRVRAACRIGQPPLGPMPCSHGVRGRIVLSGLHADLGFGLARPGPGCSSASCRDRSRPPSSRSRSRSAGT